MDEMHRKTYTRRASMPSGDFDAEQIISFGSLDEAATTGSRADVQKITKRALVPGNLPVGQVIKIMVRIPKRRTEI